MEGLSGEGAGSGSAVGMAYQIVVSPNGERRFSYVSATCEALNGVTAEAAMADADALYSLILPDHRSRLHAVQAEARIRRKLFSIEVPILRPDGALRWHRLTSAPRPLEDGSVLWDGFQVDITEQRIAQRRLEMAVDATSLGLWEFDVATGRLYWSTRTREIFGVGPDEPVDFEVYQSRIHPDDRAVTLGAYETALTTGGDFTVEHRTVAPDGRVRWLLGHGRVIVEGGEPRMVLGTALEITERKQAEETRALLLGELNHRVKNDFQIVSGLLQMQARRAEDPDVREELEKALRRIDGIARAHQNLYADQGGAEVEMSDYLGAVCRHLSDGMFEDLAARLAWRVEPFSLPRERAVAVGLIVNELVTNAVKHAFADGRPGLVEVTLERTGEGPRLVVADDGPGLPPDYAEARGIGRTLVQAFAKQARGEIRVVSGRDQGARFTLQMLP